jgi:hypothetical protein
VCLASLWHEEDEDSVIQELPAIVWRVGALQEAAPDFDASDVITR